MWGGLWREIFRVVLAAEVAVAVLVEVVVVEREGLMDDCGDEDEMGSLIAKGIREGRMEGGAKIKDDIYLYASK